MTPLEVVLVYAVGPLLLLGLVGGAAWWSANRGQRPQFPVLQGGRPVSFGRPRTAPRPPPEPTGPPSDSDQGPPPTV